ncbi:MAG: AraC family transcriptional regulator [Candidatus Obscuribacterales bacterium]|nr:AraC family transcriptional regulator [Candidatus Obscuribacterales bacterium]
METVAVLSDHQESKSGPHCILDQSASSSFGCLTSALPFESKADVRAGPTVLSGSIHQMFMNTRQNVDMEDLIRKLDFESPDAHYVRNFTSPYISFSLRQSSNANRVGFHAHDYDEFIYSPTGLSSVNWLTETDEAARTLHSGAILWTPAGVPHAAKWDSAWYSIGILIDTQVMTDHLGAKGLNRPNTTLFFDINNELRRLIHISISSNWLTRLADRQFSWALSALFASELVSSQLNSKRLLSQPRSDEIPVGHLCAYIEQNMDKDITVNALASMVHMSPYHFSRRFKAKTGLSPHKFIRTRKLSKALSLLSNTSLSTQEISSRIGFMSASSFNKAFKKDYGVTPAVYRKGLTK